MAYQFNGLNQLLELSNTFVTSLPISFACWFYPRVTGLGHLMAIDNLASYSSFRLSIDANSKLRGLTVNSDATNIGIAAAATSINVNTWQHAAATFTSSSDRAVFFNGAKTINTTSVTISTVNRIALGAVSGSAGFSNSQYFNGSIAEAAIWTAVLTDAEVASLAAGFTPDQIRPQSLQFYAPLIRDLIDVRGGRAITNVNSATVATHPRIYT